MTFFSQALMKKINLFWWDLRLSNWYGLPGGLIVISVLLFLVWLANNYQFVVAIFYSFIYLFIFTICWIKWNDQPFYWYGPHLREKSYCEPHAFSPRLNSKYLQVCCTKLVLTLVSILGINPKSKWTPKKKKVSDFGKTKQKTVLV